MHAELIPPSTPVVFALLPAHITRLVIFCRSFLAQEWAGHFVVHPIMSLMPDGPSIRRIYRRRFHDGPVQLWFVFRFRKST